MDFGFKFEGEEINTGTLVRGHLAIRDNLCFIVPDEGSSYLVSGRTIRPVVTDTKLFLAFIHAAISKTKGLESHLLLVQTKRDGVAGVIDGAMHELVDLLYTWGMGDELGNDSICSTSALIQCKHKNRCNTCNKVTCFNNPVRITNELFKFPK